MSFINTIREDIKTVQAQDPAAQNGLVIFLSYPGLHAKWNHVPEHWLWEHGHRSLARVLSQLTRHITGVEIHPAAQIGKHFFIDHAMGVVRRDHHCGRQLRAPVSYTHLTLPTN